MKNWKQWDGFEGRQWKEEINVRDFIQKNYTPYDGDESFLEGATEATDKLCIPEVSQSDICYVSQARPMRNAIDKFYHLYSVLSCDMEHADLSHVPTDKSFLRLSTRMREFRGIIPPSNDYSSHLYTHDPIDPVVEYIYGQRKIVI